MTKVAFIVKEHRAAAAKQRKVNSDPKKAREFLLRVGILAKSGKRLSKRYR